MNDSIDTRGGEAVMVASKAKVLWLMGPTSSGKTTIAKSFVKQLQGKGCPVLHYDGDEVRDFFGDSLGFASSDRLRVVKTLVHLANKGVDGNVNVVVSALTANQDARDYVDKFLKNKKVVLIKCAIEICAKRDPKGLYKKALNGEIDTLIGFNAEYKEPELTDLIIDTENCSIEDSLQSLSTFWYNIH